MLRWRLVLLVVVGALSAGGGAAYAATHGPAHPAAKHPVVKAQPLVWNLHYPCHSHGAKLTAAQL